MGYSIPQENRSSLEEQETQPDEAKGPLVTTYSFNPDVGIGRVFCFPADIYLLVAVLCYGILSVFSFLYTSQIFGILDALLSLLFAVLVTHAVVRRYSQEIVVAIIFASLCLLTSLVGMLMPFFGDNHIKEVALAFVFTIARVSVLMHFFFVAINVHKSYKQACGCSRSSISSTSY
ncbi:hypothetical protein Q1695_013690 [Nippostrongylus brasiliensis]|nr:hypothetical protein Q1695_013690 [Nippostrongylus brasiliensis]